MNQAAPGGGNRLMSRNEREGKGTVGISWIDQDKCDGCGRCDLICPEDVIKLDRESKKAFIKYIRDCQSCFLCERECPQEAIYVTPYRERRAVLPW